MLAASKFYTNDTGRTNNEYNQRRVDLESRGFVLFLNFRNKNLFVWHKKLYLQINIRFK